MFYQNQPSDRKMRYQHMLATMCSLSRLFSTSSNPYLDSRIAENLFCLCLEAKNIARSDCTADAVLNGLGIGIKTWTQGAQLQKIAEFNRLRNSYNDLTGLELARKISNLRNDRINFACTTYGLSELIYHCTIREKGSISIYESPLSLIDTQSIHILNEKDHTISFTDNINEYSFNRSKSVLLKRFVGMELLETIPVNIIENPFVLLDSLLTNANIPIISAERFESVILPLYSYSSNKGHYVPERSGLNQWNAKGRKRKCDEVYIQIPTLIRNRYPDFFPDRTQSFDLVLPNGTVLSAKVCQDDGKALMSNPNVALGKWLLRDLFKLKEGTLMTYKKLVNIGIDSVRIEKLESLRYRINFSKLGSYEKFVNGRSQC